MSPAGTTGWSPKVPPRLPPTAVERAQTEMDGRRRQAEGTVKLAQTIPQPSRWTKIRRWLAR